MESGEGGGGDLGTEDRPAMIMRPIYQPYSMMDNLGQAFSQVDSNTHDLDEQSLSSNRQSMNGVPNVYPGVAMMEEEQKRFEQEGKFGQGNNNLGPYSMHDYEKGTSSAFSAGNSNTNASSSSDQEKKQQQHEKNSSHSASSTAPNTTSQNGNRPILRFKSRNRSHDDIDNGYEEEDDDDNELGIQTVNF